jgi:hypothetical protein
MGVIPTVLQRNGGIYRLLIRVVNLLGDMAIKS